MKKLKLFVKIAILVAMFAAFVIPESRAWILNTAGLFKSLDEVREYIRGFGAVAAVVSFFLMIFQSIAAPLPAFLITFSNAAIFGWVWGALLSWSSAMAGAALCFGIARLYGRDAVIKLSGKTSIDSVEDFFKKYGGRAILVARLFPFMPFDPVSYAAGLTAMRFWPFFVATGVGQLPATLIYSYAGDKLAGGAKTFVIGLLVMFAAVALIFLIRSIFKEKKLQPEESAAVPVEE